MLEVLSKEVQLLIYSYLDFTTICTLQQINRSSNITLKDESLWKRLRLAEFQDLSNIFPNSCLGHLRGFKLHYKLLRKAKGKLTQLVKPARNWNATCLTREYYITVDSTCITIYNLMDIENASKTCWTFQTHLSAIQLVRCADQEMLAVSPQEFAIYSISSSDISHRKLSLLHTNKFSRRLTSLVVDAVWNRGMIAVATKDLDMLLLDRARGLEIRRFRSQILYLPLQLLSSSCSSDEHEISVLSAISIGVEGWDPAINVMMVKDGALQSAFYLAAVEERFVNKLDGYRSRNPSLSCCETLSLEPDVLWNPLELRFESNVNCYAPIVAIYQDPCDDSFIYCSTKDCCIMVYRKLSHHNCLSCPFTKLVLVRKIRTTLPVVTDFQRSGNVLFAFSRYAVSLFNASDHFQLLRSILLPSCGSRSKGSTGMGGDLFLSCSSVTASVFVDGGICVERRGGKGGKDLVLDFLDFS